MPAHLISTRTARALKTVFLIAAVSMIAVPSLMGASAFGGEATYDPTEYLKLWGGPNREIDTFAGFSRLNEGDLAGAEAAFNTAQKARPDKDPAALNGLSILAAAKNEFQKSLELACKSIAACGANSPIAEAMVESAAELLPLCKDPAPFLNLFAKDVLLGKNSNLSPHVRDIIRACMVDWQLQRGQYAAAIKTAEPLHYVDKWMMIGPFDNRDKAGFAVVQEPEREISFDRLCEGRNRRVCWFPIEARACDGRYVLSDIYEPRIHVHAYAATFVKSENETDAVLRAGCAGALAVWVNGISVGKVFEYNDYGRDKLTVPIALRKGWNVILVKSAVVEETQWAFSLRLCEIGGSSLSGVTFDNSAKALEEWKAEKAPAPSYQRPGIHTPPDLGIVNRLQELVKAHPDDPALLSLLASMMDSRKLGEKNNSSGDAVSPEKLYQRAIALAPKNPLLKVDLATRSDDSNEARLAAEAAFKSHPDVPCVLDTLAYLAHENHTHIAAEDYARKVWSRGGAEKTGLAALVLADEISGIDRSFATGVNNGSSGSSGKSERAEAWRILKDFTEHHPYMADAWIRLADLENSRALRRQTIEKALTYCGGNARLRQMHVADLARLGKDAEAAKLTVEPLAAQPFDMAQTVYSAYVFRRAGDAKEANRILEDAHKWAPDQPDLMGAIADQRHREGKSGEAAMLFKQVLAIKPNSPQVKDYLVLLDSGSGIDRQFFAAYDVALKDLAIPKPEQFPRSNIVRMLNQHVVRVNPNGSTSRMFHEISKVLRPAGIHEVQDHYIYYEPERQTVDILRAAVITPDGRELARAIIHDRSTSAAMGAQTLIYDEHHLKHVQFKDLEPGCTVDLQYVIRDSGSNIYGDYFAESFYFGDGHPTMRSEFILDYPKSLAMQTKTLNADVVSERVQTKDDNRETVKWVMKDIKGIEREYAMPPVVDGLPQLQLSTMRSWQEVGTWFWNLAKEQVIVNDEMRRDIALLIKDCKTDTEKLRAIHDWVIRKIRYLGIEFGRNGYKPHRATETYKALYGDCKDTATLVTAMLKSVGIESKLVLIRTVDSGANSPDSLPMPNIYNHCIAYVPNVDGKDYWIDGTTDYYQLGELPSADHGAQVMVAGPEGGKFMKIPQSAGSDNLIQQEYSVKVASSGAASMILRDTRSGHFAPALRESIETPGKYQSKMKDYLARRFNGAKVEKFTFSDPLTQGPAWSEMAVEIPNLGMQSGERLMLPAAFEGASLTKNYAADARRTHDIELYIPWSRKTDITYHFQPGVKILSLPEAVKIEKAFGKYVRTVTQTGNDLVISEYFEMPHSRIVVKDYEAFKDFCIKVDAAMEQNVLVQEN